jgi:hypothetical protein
MRRSESIAELAAALALAQAEIENATKGSVNPHFKSRYADLAEVLNTARPVLAKHGVAIVQSTSFADGVVSVDTVLAHKSGQWMESTASAPVGKADAQGVGAATTYLRRYSLAAMVGIAQEDDDGESVAVREPPRQPQPVAIQPRKPVKASAAAVELAKKMLATELVTEMGTVADIEDKSEVIALSALRAKRVADITGGKWEPDERTARAVEWIVKQAGG